MPPLSLKHIFIQAISEVLKFGLGEVTSEMETRLNFSSQRHPSCPHFLVLHCPDIIGLGRGCLIAFNNVHLEVSPLCSRFAWFCAILKASYSDVRVDYMSECGYNPRLGDQ